MKKDKNATEKGVIALHLKEAREKNNLRQKDVIELLDKLYNLPYQRGTLSQWERGHSKPNKDVFIALAQIYKVSIEYLMGGSDYPDEESYQLDVAREEFWHETEEIEPFVRYFLNNTGLYCDEDKRDGMVFMVTLGLLEREKGLDNYDLYRDGLKSEEYIVKRESPNGSLEEKLLSVNEIVESIYPVYRAVVLAAKDFSDTL